VIAPGAEEDIAAEAWIQVVRGLSAFRGDEQAWRAWLFTSARRRAIDLARRRARRPEAPLDDLTAGQLPSARDSAEAAIENLGTAAAIAVVAGLDTESVSRLLHKSPGAVRVAAHRGLRRLAEITVDAGVTL